MPEAINSPGYLNFLAWLDTQDLEEQGHIYEWSKAAELPPGGRVHTTYKTLTLWNNPIRGVVAVYDLDENGDRISDGNGGYSTHNEEVALTSLPSNTGTINGDPA